MKTGFFIYDPLVKRYHESLSMISLQFESAMDYKNGCIGQLVV